MTKKNFTVTVSLIRGYRNDDVADPILELKEFKVDATTEAEAFEKGKALDTSHYSVYEIYADENN